MARRRLLAIVGALGLAAGLCTSAVGAQAAGAEPDATFNALVFISTTMANNGGSACLKNWSRVALATDGTCAIDQGPGQTNVAICIQNNTPGDVEVCRITQSNGARNNYALVIQRYKQNGGFARKATQYAAVNQGNVTGSNFLAEFQLTTQSTDDADANNTQTQDVQQFAGSPANHTTQNSTSGGSNYALVAQNSNQMGESERSVDKTQTSNEVGFLDQTDNGTGLSKNLVAQGQVQRLQGSGSQTQTVDPRCCSAQGINTEDRFTIVQHTDQEGGTQALQKATSFGTCHTKGNCTVNQSSRQHGMTKLNQCPPPNSTGPSHDCAAALVCTNGGCPVQTPQCVTEGTPACPLPPPNCPNVVCPTDAPVVSLSSHGTVAARLTGRPTASLIGTTSRPTRSSSTTRLT
jgi:hypothetical protein